MSMSGQLNGHDHSISDRRAHQRIDEISDRISVISGDVREGLGRHDERLKTMQDLATNTLVQMTAINTNLEVIKTDIHGRIDTLNDDVQQVKGAGRLVAWMGPKGVAMAVILACGGGAMGAAKLFGG